MLKKIAVLLSAYNGERYIEEQIESILNQIDIDNIRLIIRNDGSCDNTINIINRLKNSNPNIEIINGNNIGLVASFFELLKYAYNSNFDYYSFSDQDDYWFPEKLSIAIRELEGKTEPCMYASCSLIADENLNTRGKTTQKKVKDITFFNSAIQNFCPGHNQVLNRAMAEKVLKSTIYSKEIYSQDLWITQVATVTGKIIFDNSPHTLYRQHSNNQLSFGKSMIEWAIDHIKRLMKNEGQKIAVQLKYFVDCYNEYLNDEQKEEIQFFFDSQKSFFKRVRYAVRTKMYRQKSYETPMFKMIYIISGYSLDTL